MKTQSFGARREPQRHIKRGMCLKVIVFGSLFSCSRAIAKDFAAGTDGRIIEWKERSLTLESVDGGKPGAHSLTRALCVGIWKPPGLLRSRRRTDRLLRGNVKSPLTNFGKTCGILVHRKRIALWYEFTSC